MASSFQLLSFIDYYIIACQFNDKLCIFVICIVGMVFSDVCYLRMNVSTFVIADMSVILKVPTKSAWVSNH
jgi:hypothetical protein